MSAGSRSNRDRRLGQRGTSAAAWFYGPLGFGSTRGSFPVTPALEPARKDDGKPARTYCPGPAGLWPCALEFSHSGDHEPRLPSSKVAEKVSEAMRRTDAGLCALCGGEVNEDGGCLSRCGEEE